MRPVNLIPPEERRGDRAPLRAGKLSYLLVAGLALVLAAVTAIVLTGNQVKDREAELAGLEQEEAAATARADALRPYAEFAALTASRVTTVTSLAESRFDWERVLRELALVLPADVWLSTLTAAASAEDAEAGASEISAPSLTITGCGDGHESVARMLQALRDIDGVTRVGLTSSALPEDTPGSTGGGEAAGECQTRDFLAGFEVQVAFDGVPVPASATAPTTPPAPAPATTETNSTSEQIGDSQDAAKLIPGVAR